VRIEVLRNLFVITPSQQHKCLAASFGLALVISLGLGGCSGLGGKKAKANLVYEERPVEILYNAGMRRLDQRSWSEAVDYFEEVERQHPYSEWSRRSIVMQIYAQYQSGNYIESFIRAQP
jgi:outer membrane protein assembly factor BamD